MIRPGDKRDRVTVISEVDQRLRGVVQTLWATLPKDQKNFQQLETDLRRLVDRALRDFKEDIELSGDSDLFGQ
jgi:hypothetical protein